jgi:hypothetical protein
METFWAFIVEASLSFFDTLTKAAAKETIDRLWISQSFTHAFLMTSLSYSSSSSAFLSSH